MIPSSKDVRSKMSQVKGLGAARHGVSHWWLQRVTAVAIVPLSAWFLYSLVTVMLSSDVNVVADWFISPINTLVMVLLLGVLFAHAKLGVQVVIEDYVHSPFAKYFLLLMNVFFCVAGAAISILAVLKLHLLNGSGAV